MPDTSKNTMRPAVPPGATTHNNAALSLGALLADVNREIRSSMNGVVGMLELLFDTGLTGAQLDYVRKAQSSSNALLALIERLADLSLIAAGQFRLASGTFDLRREAEGAFIGKQEAAQAKGLRFSATLPLQCPPVDGDAARIQALLSCLADIMIGCAGQGEISFLMTASCERPGMCRIGVDINACSVTETGKQLLAAMSQPGALDAAMLRSVGRDALEPVLCAQLARLLDASIDVRTDERNVTTLRCSLTLPAAAHPLPPLRGLLIAERSAEWQALSTLFIKHDIKIDTMDSATDGLLALKRAASNGNPYRIVMLGSRVQGMDATILSTAIKGDTAGRDAMLVLLSEQSDNDAAVAQAGFSAVIGKSDLQDAVLRVLKQIRTGAAAGMNRGLSSTADASTLEVVPTRAANPDGKRRILIADDNPVNREVAARMLEKLGFECVHAADGREAVDMHRSEPFDLILMDCEMPQMDGFQATTLIRSQERTSAHTPVIALTASTSQGEREKCLASGMDDFLSKPIRPQLLSDILARWTPVEAPSSPSSPSSASSASTASTPLNDELDAVHAMFGADFAELATLYQRDTPPRIASLHRAYAEGDKQHVAKVAHALGGSSASIGATGLSGVCKEIEMRAKAGALDGFEQAMASIENEYRRISSKLQSLTG